MAIEIRSQTKFSARISKTHFARIAARTLRAEAVAADLSIYFTSDAEIRRLNRWFHSTDSATDVLSFPASLQSAKGARLPRAPQLARHPYLGDIVISYERARAQARTAGWLIRDELELLVIHGILHLVGYDDRMLRAQARMWKRQREIMHKEIPGAPKTLSGPRRSHGL